MASTHTMQAIGSVTSLDSNSLLNALDIGIIICSAKKTIDIEYVNPAWCKLTRYTKTDVVGLAGGSKFLQGPETDPKSIEQMARAIEEQTKFSGLVLNYTKPEADESHGVAFWNELTIVPVFVYGQLTKYVGTSKDVTRQLEERQVALDASTAKLKANAELLVKARELMTLVETANAPIIGVDIDGRINEWNAKATEVTGFTRKDATGKSLVECYITADYRANVQEVLDRAMEGTATDSYEFPLYTKGGARVEVLLNATARRAIDGTIVGVIGVGQDITALRAEQREKNELHEEARRAQAAFDRVADVVLTLTKVTSFDPCNFSATVTTTTAAAFTQLFGSACASDPSGWINSVEEEPDRQKLRALLCARVSSGYGEFVFRCTGKGHRRTVRVSVVYDADVLGDATLVVVLHDLTDFRQRVEAQREAAVLRSVASSVSHDEKNAALEATEDTLRLIEFLESIWKQMQLQNTLITAYHPDWIDCESTYQITTRILDQATELAKNMAKRGTEAQNLAHMRAMHYQLCADEYIAIAQEVDVLAVFNALYATSPSVALSVSDVPPLLFFDSNLMSHGVRNGVSNALKYGCNRRAAIEVYYDSMGPMLHVKITNQVLASVQRRLIEVHGHDATYLLHTKNHRGGENSTLIGGRALTSSARLLGGDVRLQFNNNETVCTLKFPVRESEKQTDCMNIVFVDDSVQILFYWDAILAAPLRGWTIPTHGCSDEEANEQMVLVAEKIMAAKPLPDAVVLDQNLVSRTSDKLLIATGTQTASRLRKAGYVGRILISSANSGATDIEKYYASGANGFLPKGASLEALLDALALAGMTPARLLTGTDTVVAREFDRFPPLQMDHCLWSNPAIKIEVREKMAKASRIEFDESYSFLRHALDTSTENNTTRQVLHRLLGGMQSIGYPRATAVVNAMRNDGVTIQLLSQLKDAMEDGELELLKA